MSRAAIYVRVSTEEQGKNHSLPTQRKLCREYCEREGIDVAKIFSDKHAGTTLDRPGLTELRDYVESKQRKIDFVVVRSIDRLSRKTYAACGLMAEWRRYGCSLRSATEPINETPAGKLMAVITSGFAEFDNDTRTLKATDGMRAALEDGQWTFQAPVGYIKLPNTKGGPSMMEDPNSGPLVRRAFELFAQGSLTKVAVLEQVTALGLRSRHGRKLRPQSLNRMLRNPLYAGRIEVASRPPNNRVGRGIGEVSRAGNWTPIVKPELFDVVQRRLAGKSPTAVPRTLNNPEFPLRRFVSCAVCGDPITGGFSTSRNRRYAYYHCRSGCLGSVSRRAVEAKFVTLLECLRPKLDCWSRFSEVVRRRCKEREIGARTLRQKLQGRLAELERREDRVSDAFLHGLHGASIDQTVFDRQLARIRRDRTDVKVQLHDAMQAEVDVDGLLGFAEHVLSDLSRFWIQLDAVGKLRLQELIFPDGITFDGESFRTAQTSPVFTYLRAIPLGKEQVACLTGFEPASTAGAKMTFNDRAPRSVGVEPRRSRRPHPDRGNDRFETCGFLG